MVDGTAVALFMQFGEMAHAAEGNAQVGRGGEKRHRAREQVGQPHADGPDEKGREFVAHHRNQHIQGLYTAKNAGIFEDVSIGGGFHSDQTGKAGETRQQAPL